MFGGFNAYASGAEYAARHEQKQTDEARAAASQEAAQAPSPAPEPAERPQPAPSTRAAGAPVMSRDELHSFFVECSERLQSDESVAEYVEVYNASVPDGDAGDKLSAAMLQTQKREIEGRGFDYDKATDAMRYVPMHFPGDLELSNAMREFMRTCRDVHQRVLQEAPAALSRDDLLRYLAEMKETILSDEVRTRLVERRDVSGGKMGEALLEIQRDGFAAFSVHPKVGVDCLSRAPIMYPDDEEVSAAMRSFRDSCHRSVVMAMRSAAPPADRLQRSGEIANGLVMEWFDACNWTMDQPEIQEELRKLFEDTKKPPTERICDIQREMLEMAIGVEREWGCQKLNNLDKRLQGSPGEMQALQVFLQRQNRACQVAMGLGEQLEKAEKEERERRARQMRLQQMQAQALQEQFKPIIDKMEALRPELMQEVASMDTDARKAFARDALRACGDLLRVNQNADHAERMTKISALSDEQLRDFTKLQVLMGLSSMARGGQPAQAQAQDHSQCSHEHGHAH